MKISIITVTLNRESLLSTNLDSVLGQTFEDYEHIIIDGASSDNTLYILRKYEPLFKGRLKYISEPDKGMYYAMNKGLKIATGDVIGILNSDDFFTSERILEQVNITLSSAETDAVYGDVHYVNPQKLHTCLRYYSSRYFRTWMMRFGFMPAHPSFYCKKSIYDRLGGFDTSFKIGADFELFLRFLCVNKIRCKYLPLDFVTMRIGGVSTSKLSAHRIIMRERLLSLAKFDIYTNRFLLALRYPIKLLEILISRIYFHFKS